jgi:hypothetical protein
MKIETQHTLKNQKKTQLKWFSKEDNETYSIPSKEKIRRVTSPRIGFQGGDKKHTVNVYSR